MLFSVLSVRPLLPSLQVRLHIFSYASVSLSRNFLSQSPSLETPVSMFFLMPPFPSLESFFLEAPSLEAPSMLFSLLPNSFTLCHPLCLILLLCGASSAGPLLRDLFCGTFSAGPLLLGLFCGTFSATPPLFAAATSLTLTFWPWGFWHPSARRTAPSA